MGYLDSRYMPRNSPRECAIALGQLRLHSGNFVEILLGLRPRSISLKYFRAYTARLRYPIVRFYIKTYKFYAKYKKLFLANCVPDKFLYERVRSSGFDACAEKYFCSIAYNMIK